VASLSSSSCGQSVFVRLEFYLARVNATEPRLADGSRMRRESHVRFCERLKVQTLWPTYHPQHPWQRGSNENTNGLLRQYFLRVLISRCIHRPDLMS
jgi:hypothetical protein